MSIVNKTVEDIKNIISVFLKIPLEKVEADSDLGQLGADSMSLIGIAAKVSEQYNVKLTPAKLVSVTTVEGIAKALLANFEQDVNQYYQQDEPESATMSATTATTAHTASTTAAQALIAKISAKYNIDLSAEVVDPNNPEEILALLNGKYKQAVAAHYQKTQQQKQQQTDTPAASTLQATQASAPQQAISHSRTQDMAIVGMSAAFPDAPDLNAFWQNLITGKNSIREIPASRWDWRDYYSETEEYGKTIAKWGAFLEDIEQFDPLFFKISPHEAQYIDPQLRLLLMQTHNAFEDAGIKMSALAGSKTGVFIGYEYSEYQHHSREFGYQNADAHPYSSSDMSYMFANQLSYTFDFQGPSEAINMNCAASAVAINRAYYSLLNQESDVAVAGGVCLHLFPEDYIASSDMLSPDGSCRVFDDNANGFTRGEGCGIVVLKRLEDAVKDNDRIYAVIKASHQNNRGAANSFSDIKPESITDVIRSCYEKTDIDPETIRYIEVDGYSTKWGDSVEYEAIKEAFVSDQQTNSTKYCGLGSLKGNIGHTEPANGVADVIKIALAMRHQQFPATISCQNVNRFIDVDKNSNPFFIVNKNTAFSELHNNNEQATPIRAALNSFADTGSNIHIVLEEYREPAHQAVNMAEPVIFVLSAKNEERLQDYALKVNQFIEQHLLTGNTALIDVAYTFQIGREAMPQRLAMVVNSFAELNDKLAGFIAGDTAIRDCYQGRVQRQQNTATFDLEGVVYERYTQLAQQWVNGLVFDWHRLYGEDKPRRVSLLPTYPFAQDRYWLGMDLEQRQEQAIPANPFPSKTKCSQGTDAGDTDTNKEAATQALNDLKVVITGMVASIVKVNTSMLHENEALKEYGFDSISLIQFSKMLNEQYQLDLTPTVFFQYDTIQAIAAYLLSAHPNVFGVNTTAENATAETKPQPTQATNNVTAVNPWGLGKRSPRFVALSAEHKNSSLLASSSISALENDPIVIVGVSGRFPMAENIDAFWQNLEDGKNCITEIPQDRWDWQALYGDPETEANKTNIKWGGFIDDIGNFDPMFFGISPGEAELMDPQQRLLMLYIWKTLEDAGHSAKSLAGTQTGIFVGTSSSGYADLLLQSNNIEAHSLTGMVSSVGPNRMSYFLDWHGPSEPIETACSSSLVAIHKAVSAINTGDCEMAIAGGINLIVDSATHIGASKLGMLSQDGKCKTFSDQADGYVRGEGIGMLLLKKLSDAKQAGDHIYGVIKGTAENHGGKANFLTAPNPQAQAELLKSAYQKAGIDPRTVSYIETHGTGTKLGDPIEIDGLQIAFKELYQQTGSTEVDTAHCGLGSVKTNIGHTELAAGVSGLIKVLLQLKHKTIVKSLHCDTVNPYIKLDNSPFYIATEKQHWTALNDTEGNPLPRRAGVSSFGFGGVNAHIVVEEYIDTDSESNEAVDQSVDVTAPYIVPLSAKNKDRLVDYARAMETFLAQCSAADHADQVQLVDLAYTLQVGRDAMEERLALLVDSLDDLQQQLHDFIVDANSNTNKTVYRGRVKQDDDMLSVFDADEDMSTIIDVWLAKKKYNKILSLWVKGLQFDWTKLYGDIKPKRISLPSYPFEQKRYWIATLEQTQGNGHHQAAMVEQSPSPATALSPMLHSICDTMQLPHIPRLKPTIMQYTREIEEFLPELLWAQLGIADSRAFIPMYDKWLRASREILQQNNYDHYDNTPVSMADNQRVWQTWQDKKESWLQEPYIKAQVLLVEEQMRALPEILTGKILATDIMFADSSMELAKEVYSSDTMAQYFTEVYCLAVAAYIEQRLQQDPQAKIRILEIGAGTGASSAKVFKILQQYSQHMDEYCYTDLSKAFLMYAEEQYGADKPWLDYKILNVEQPLEQQGIEVGSYDMVLAANVLHATKNIRHTLQHTRSALKSNGVLILNEIGDNDLYSHLAFGLLEGWWLYDDAELRIKNCPGIYPETWQRILIDEGFQSVFFPAEKAHQYALQIVVAQNGASHFPEHTDSNKYHPQATQTQPQTTTPTAQRMNGVNGVNGINGVNHATIDITADNIEAHIKAIVIQELAVSLKTDGNTIDEDGSFSDYGIDSILGVNLVRNINEQLAIQLGTTILFDYASVNKLTAYILSTYQDVIAKTLTASSAPSFAEEPLTQQHQPSDTLAPQPSVEVTDEMVEEHIKEVLIKELAVSLKTDSATIDESYSFSDYGIDSILGVNLVRNINQQLTISLGTTILFDYASVNKLSAYILSTYKAAITEKLAETMRQPIDINANHNHNAQLNAHTAEKKTVDSVQHITSVTDDVATLSRQNNKNNSKSKDIAIIGMSGRFAQADTPQQLWQHLVNEADLIKPASRWGEEGAKRNYGSFVDNIDQFDPLFFKISGLEAKYMDPQQRLFLQEAWNALEDAGYAGKKIEGSKCGVYVGCGAGGYEELFGDDAPSQSFWGNSSSITPARIAYYLNLKGPAIAIDTACSSSLVAIHLACQGLWSGETEVALAGGVYIQSTPGLYALANNADMLSHSGRCYTFDDRANGFVLGEGVGVVMLKRLDDAIADRDHIYGVIKGSGINQDGTTNGITAPSALSQQSLELSVYDSFDIDPANIQMVEAHGTGTTLGDPIEYEALTQSFRHYTDKKEYCAIGSLKTNIGHTAMAAGVASVIKILLSLQHQQIPASIHFKNGNPNITFKNSPFYVNTALRDWDTLNGDKRCAVTSAFGFSGTNAHLVIEEAPELETQQQEANNTLVAQAGYLIALSANTEGQLRQQAQRLAAFCETHPTTHCGNMSFTLLLGRKHLEHRLTCVVHSVDELQQLLNTWLQDPAKVSTQVQTADSSLSARKQKVAAQQAAKQSLEHGVSETSARAYSEHLTAIATAYRQGADIDFAQLFTGQRYYTISLPTYPFAKDRYWVAEKNQQSATPLSARLATNKLHPLLHRNTSHLNEQRFSSTFTGDEFFLADHVVAGERILPGVTYLELARAAVQQATSESDHQHLSHSPLLLKNVIWTQAVSVTDTPKEVHIRLIGKDNGEIAYEIYSTTNNEDVVYNQGSAWQVNATEVIPAVNIQQLKAECSQRMLSAEACYNAFHDAGLKLGASLQSIEQVYVGNDCVLAKLSLPTVVADSASDFVLHPSLLDASLQASIALFSDVDTATPHLPFALEQLEVFGKTSASMWATIRYAEHGDGGSTNGLKKLDIELCDDNGVVCLRMKAFCARELKSTPQEQAVQPASHPVATEMEILVPVWDAVFPLQDTPTPALPTSSNRVLVIGGNSEQQQRIQQAYPHTDIFALHANDSIDTISQQLSTYTAFEHIFWLTPVTDHDALIAAQETGVIALFKTVKALLTCGYDAQTLAWTIITFGCQQVTHNDTIHPAHASIHGFVGTMAKEYAHWQVRLLDLELPTGSPNDFPLVELVQLPTNAYGDALCYRHQTWYQQTLLPLANSVAQDSAPIYRHAQHERVYVVIGGAGGIGRVWSEYMMRHYGTKIVWLGRRAEDEAIYNQITALSKLGTAPLYIRADAADAESLATAYQQIKQTYPQIHGVVHSAIVLADKSLANMQEDTFRAPLLAKVNASVHMAQVFATEPLDFMLFFSSEIAFSKSIGQSNYAAGTTFKDAFAKSLATQVSCPVKVINWGYWGTTGIVASDDYRQRMEQLGLLSIEPDEGMAALDAVNASQWNQAVINKTSIDLVDEYHASINESIREYPALLASYVPYIRDHIGQQLPEIPAARHHFERQMAEMDEVLLQLLAHDLYDLQHTDTPLLPLFDRWLEESQRVLQHKHYASTNREALWQTWDAKKVAWLQDPDMQAAVHVVEATMRVLPDILIGKIAATDVLFPDSSMKLVEGIYKNNHVADYFNEVLCLAVTTYIQQRLHDDPSAQIKILEIGAGTGGTSAMLFPKLSPYQAHISEYCYTDISKAFLLHAKNSYGADNPYLSYKLFDVQQPIATQDIAADDFDIVFASNSIHATSNIFQALRNAKAALKTNGLFILNEISSNDIFTHLTFGLLDGWWLYEDVSVRIPGCPGLYPEQWQYVLNEEGFDEVFFPIEAAHERGQQIIVAQSNGVVRQQLSAEQQSPKQHTTQQAIQPKQPTPVTTEAEPVVNDALLKQKSTDYMVQLVADTLQLPFDRINPAKPLEKYGIDSILVVSLTNALRQHFDDISPALFFEYQTIDGLIDHFIQSKKESLLQLTGLADVTTTATTAEFKSEPEAEMTPNKPTHAPIDLAQLQAKSTEYMVQLVADTLQLPAAKINPAAPLEKYGIDSILVVSLTNTLRQHFDDISPALFFEHQTINGLIDHFMATRQEALITLTGMQTETPPPSPPQPPVRGQWTKRNPSKTKPSPVQPAMRQQQAELSTSNQIAPTQTTTERSSNTVVDIAIIGISGRYPQADNLAEFWQNLQTGKNCISQVPKERWDWQQYFDPEKGKAGKMYSKWGGFLNEVDKFDPLFFGISPIEADGMDPQERLFLEEVYACISDAGYTPDQLSPEQKVGVYVGVMNGYYPTGASYWSIANRISYLMNFHGASLAIDTACSASLTAVHLAVESLYSGVNECAIAGGVNLIIDPEQYVGLSAMRVLTDDSRCKSFGAGADGIVDSEGVGAILLKPLTKAIADEDHIYGVIKGSMLNAGGKTNGYMVPNPVAQSALVVDALKRAKVDARQISYLEAHGTGTKLGDPIEIAGLNRAFGTQTSDKAFCALGSVKSNIGHSESAAGIAGISKILLQLKHQKIAPSLHSKTLNPDINFANTPFTVQQTLADWERPVIDGKSVLRCAGISSFGAGGANAHVIIEEYEEQHVAQDIALQQQTTTPRLFVLSAKNTERLQAYAAKIASFLQRETGTGTQAQTTDIADYLQQDLLQSASQLLNVDASDIDSEENLTEYGFDTVSFASFNKRIHQQYSFIDVMNTLTLAKHCSIKQCADYLLASYPQHMRDYYQHQLPHTTHYVPSLHLANITYTLQTGREMMDERLAIIVHSLEELNDKLQQFIDGDTAIDAVYHGNAKRDKAALAVLDGDDDVMQNMIDTWIDKQHYAKLAEFWVKGLSLDWQKLYNTTTEKVRRMSLPTYPFAKERYWMAAEKRVEQQPALAQTVAQQPAQLHPLLHKNTSDFSGQRFTSVFTGDEFFLADHVINGEKMLPGMAYLELARAAIEQASGETNNPIVLKNIVWLESFCIEQAPKTLHIRLFQREQGEVSFEICHRDVIYSQGAAVIASHQHDNVPTLNLAGLQAECNQQTLTATEYYQMFKATGVDYGASFCNVQQVFVGQNSVLAKLVLAPEFVADLEDFTLHPAVLDSALQACVGLTWGEENASSELPFALEQLDIFAKTTTAMWAYVWRDQNDATNDSALTKLHIDLADENGRLCVRLKGFSTRAIGHETAIAATTTQMPTPTLLSIATWTEKPITAGMSHSHTEYGSHQIILCDSAELTPQVINHALPTAQCIAINAVAESNDTATRFTDYALGVFAAIKHSLQQTKTNHALLLQVVASSASQATFVSGLAGLLKTARMEHPKLITQLIEFDTLDNKQAVLDGLQASAQSPADIHIRYQAGQRRVATLQPTVTPTEQTIPWKDNGVYLITGGVGGLGLVFAKEISQQVKQATLILAGRSALSDEKQAMLNALSATGHTVVYRQMDVSQFESVSNVIEHIKQDFARLDGIIHSAGIIADNFIIKKSTDEFKQVLNPKVSGMIHLDQASKALPLDFFICFSSLATLGSIGQADYACANDFMDNYAHYRRELVLANKRSGLTQSIAWPLWKEGGMQIDQQTEQQMEHSTGMCAMTTQAGMSALYHSLALNAPSVMVFAGDVAKIKRLVIDEAITKEEHKEVATHTVSTAADITLPVEKVEQYLKEILSSETGLAMHRIESDVPMDEYGIDSIMVMQMTNQLEQTFGSLSKTLFFEYQNIHELAHYFIQSHREQVESLLGLDKPQASRQIEQKPARVTPVKPVSESLPQTAFATTAPSTPEVEPETETTTSDAFDIAIIGVSGRYPKADNVDMFWHNLAQGEDCVTEIPPDRWDNSQYFAESKAAFGKNYCKWGGFINDVDKFDSLFFNISPGEAETMEPNERLFMETVWNLLESSGYTKASLKQLYDSKVGVFAGNMFQQYHAFKSDFMSEALMSVASDCSIANQVSIFFDFKGPSMTIGTACSSSLTAIHMACESLLKDDCKVAIAGGINLSIHPKKYIALSASQFIGSKRDSRSFGEGDGYLPSEGVGAILLKPLAEAQKDNDTILAVIKSSTINHGGRGSGFSVLNTKAQTDLLLENFKLSGVDPQSISYVEAAASGDPAGDPVELKALSQAFAQFTDKKQFCAIGSAKSNIGHTEAASGIAQLTKVLLQLHYQQLAPTIYADPVNPDLELAETPFYLERELTSWQRPVLDQDDQPLECPRRAIVSSFGAGGSNAQVLLEEYNAKDSTHSTEHTASQSPVIFVLSAKDEQRLHDYVLKMKAFFHSPLPAVNYRFNLDDIAYTLQTGREAMACRLAMVVSSKKQLLAGLDEYLRYVDSNKSADALQSIFVGNTDTHSETKSLLTGTMGKAVLKTIFEQRNDEEMAQYWTKGLTIDWQLLYNERPQKPHKLFLPTYPFARQRCWVNVADEVTAKPATVTNMRPVASTTANTTQPAQPEPLMEQAVIGIVSDVLKMTKSDLNLDRPLEDYGLNSMLAMSLLQQLQVHTEVSLEADVLQQCKTTRELIAFLPQPAPSEALTDVATHTTPASAHTFVAKPFAEFPELIHLNRATTGRPVFWIHPGGSGVSEYIAIANVTDRPFYGIQARGSDAKRTPLKGVQAMAAYYTHIIKTVDPVGPYDLGGYSFGGMLAYETARQLQELGGEVQTLVMLDSFSEIKQEKEDKKGSLFALVNTLLMSSIFQQPDKIAETLIHQDNIDFSLPYDAFVDALLAMARKCGLTQTKAELETQLEAEAKVDSFYEAHKYKIVPLSAPESITCHYFRDKSGLFIGDLQLYYSREESNPYDHVDHWAGWKPYLPNAQVIEVNSSSHSMMLNEPESYEVILAHCQTLYA